MRLLFHWLLTHLVFAGTMFFAAGATVGDLGTGGGDGGGSGDGGGESSGGDGSAGDSTGNGGDGEPTISDESSAEGTENTDGQTDPNALIDSGDGRKIPQKYTELFKNDKALREIYFSQQALKKTFPGGVKEAVELARTVEEFGGIEAFEAVKSELNTYHSDAELFLKDQTKWVERSFEEDVDASLKAFTASLDYVGEKHPEHYNYLMAKVILNDLNASLPVREIYDTLAALTDNPKAQDGAKKLASYYNIRADLSQKVPEKQMNPQQKKIDEKNEQLTKREQEIRNKSINTEASPYLNRTIETSLAVAAKNAGFDFVKLQKEQPNRYGRFLKDVRRAIHDEVLADEKWLNRYSDALALNDTAKCVRMLNARHDQAIKGTDSKPGVVAPVFYEWFGAPKAGRKALIGDNGGTGGMARRDGARGTGNETPAIMNSLPPAKDINYNDPITDKWNGIYRLKNGKLIQVKRP